MSHTWKFWIGYGVIAIVTFALAALIGDKGIWTLMLSAAAANVATIVSIQFSTGIKAQFARGLLIAVIAVTSGTSTLFLISRFL